METSFDKRIVRYEEIHNILQEDFDFLCNLINPKKDQLILDLGAGYGSCTREIIKRYSKNKFNFILTDNSDVQLNRAKSEIPKSILDYNSPSDATFILDDITNSNLSKDTFDIIIAKMVIHEINRSKQLSALKEIYRLLKPGGKLIIWDLYLHNDNQKFFQSIISQKDKLCKFDTLYKNRYFLTGKEIFNNLTLANFKIITKEKDIMTPLTTYNRLKDEFNNDRCLLDLWHLFILEEARKANPFILFDLSFKYNGEYISLTPPKAILTAIK